jgi:uncharacterized protein YkwD
VSWFERDHNCKIGGISFAFPAVKFGVVACSLLRDASTLATVLADYPGGPDEVDDPVLVTRHRKATRLALGAVVVLALLLVGAAAFGGTVLLGGFGSVHQSTAQQSTGHQNQGNAEGPAVGDPSAGAQDQSTEAPPPTRSPAKSTAPKAMPSMDLTHVSAETAVLRLVNAERAKAGCQALTVDTRLATAARLHSADMVARHYFSHTTPDGVTFSSRITAAGYKWSLAGENIAAGQPDASAVMRSWMGSPGHRANILNCRFRQIGVGLALESPRRPVWTQDFGTPQ